jgi:FkbM family methyltransferase
MVCGMVRFYSEYGFLRVMLRMKDKLYRISPNFIKGRSLLEFKEEGIKEPFFLRKGTADIGTYMQIFLNKEYEFTVMHHPKVIIDAGANIGLASIFFANKYPDVKIIAIEPEKSNFDLLKKNVKSYSNIIPVQSALWDRNEDINLVDTGLGSDGFVTQKEGEMSEEFRGVLSHLAHGDKISTHYQVPGMTVNKIMKDYECSEVDILKIDIEGAEKEVFKDTSAWIGNINSIIVELHDSTKSGCSRSFYNGSNGFDYEWSQGESVILSRKDYLKQIDTAH